MNLTKYAQRLKLIRRVKAAIKFRQRTQQRLAPIRSENKETKKYILQKLAYTSQQVRGHVRTARRNAEEDWNLGPLRPNRAVGPDAERYGALKREQMREPAMPKHWFDAKDSVQKRMKTQIPKNVFSDQWPIAKDDRVVVIRGREKNRIGYVHEVLKESNQITLKGLNKVWVDGRIFNQVTGEEPEIKREWDHTLSYNDVRLVIPYDTYPVVNGRVVKMRQDVIVDDVDLEKHTRGINPFTGVGNEQTISEEHQVDPTTEEVIWHRYIAGTHEPIEWPWEKSKQKEADEKRRDRGGNEEEVAKSKKKEGRGVSDFIRTLGGLRKDPKAQDQNEKELLVPKPGNRLEKLNPELITRAKPREYEPPDYDDDTTRNLIEITQNDLNYFVPILVYPPMPDSIIEELRDQRAFKYDGISEEKEMTKERRTARQRAKQQKRIINLMRTPMQIRWESDQAKKEKRDLKSPPQLSEDLLLALGKHMAANGKGLSLRRELDAARAIAKVDESRGGKEAKQLLA